MISIGIPGLDNTSPVTRRYPAGSASSMNTGRTQPTEDPDRGPRGQALAAGGSGVDLADGLQDERGGAADRAADQVARTVTVVDLG